MLEKFLWPVIVGGGKAVPTMDTLTFWLYQVERTQPLATLIKTQARWSFLRKCYYSSWEQTTQASSHGITLITLMAAHGSMCDLAFCQRSMKECWSNRLNSRDPGLAWQCDLGQALGFCRPWLHKKDPWSEKWGGTVHFPEWPVKNGRTCAHENMGAVWLVNYTEDCCYYY